MITGNETNGLYNLTVQAIMNAIYGDCQDGGDINRAARDSINHYPDGGVYEYVYDVYDPTYYQRRYQNGGLADDGNLVTTNVTNGGNSVTLELEDRTREWPGGSSIIPDPAFYVSDLVEMGSYGDKWPFSQIWYTQQARPYLDQSLADESVSGGGIDRAITNTAATVGLIPW